MNKNSKMRVLTLIPEIILLRCVVCSEDSVGWLYKRTLDCVSSQDVIFHNSSFSENRFYLLLDKSLFWNLPQRLCVCWKVATCLLSLFIWILEMILLKSTHLLKLWVKFKVFHRRGVNGIIITWLLSSYWLSATHV